MANRTMQQKRLKMARQRRAWAKQYRQRSFMVPNREVIKEYKHHAKGLEVDERVIDELVILQQIKDKNPNPGIPRMTSEERKAALKRQAELEADTGTELRIIGPTGRDQLQESWIYFTSRKDCFVLVHRDLDLRIERRSVTFSSKELLIMCWERDAINWATKKRIEP